MDHAPIEAMTDAIDRARRHSPFLARALDRQPELVALLADGRAEEALQRARAITAADTASELRQQRLALAAVLAVGDLAEAFPPARVMAELSAFADHALDRAITHAITARVPDAAPAGFVALALGKQGAGELNYSSDIDPILLYDPVTLPRRPRDEPAETAQRYARAITELLSRQTAEGYVFRVDLRLRPASEVSPPAISFDAALSHYESSAVAWERAAFIRARAAGGDIAAGERFLQAITPFVWRRSLDFTAIEDIRRLTRRIREAYDGPQAPGPGYDLKRGRGGIREIEFFAQTHQLVHGGRRPALRLRGTRAALDALAAEGLIAGETALALGTAYDRLRTIEHRLQMVDDRQTHSLPDSAAALDNVARLDGLPDGAALVSELDALTRTVAGHYDTLLGEDRSTPQMPALAHHHAERVAGWRATLRALRGPEARVAFDAVLPWLLDAFDKAPDPPQAMARWERLLARLPSAVNLFRLFEQRPGLLEEVLRLLTLSRPLGDALAHRPALLDRLIDRSALDLPPSVPALQQAMQPVDRQAGDLEARLDRIRQVVGEERFALGTQLVMARHDALDVADGLGRVAEAALGCAAEAATAEFEVAHGRVPGGRLLVLGLGRLGGGALTHASDLDLVYLFTGEIGVESDGPRPLTASLYFNRLAQRVTAALSVPTSEGALYEVDTRLRPQGAQGPLAVSLDSFGRYQREEAWTWEHMALTRARPMFGAEEDRAALTALLQDILHLPRDPDRLRADVLAMRAEMAAHKAPVSELDVKLLRGGLVDLEFLVHYLQLRDRAALQPHLPQAIATLAARDQLPAAVAHHHGMLTRVLVAQRLFAPAGDIPPPVAQDAFAAACGLAGYPALLQSVAEARGCVAQAWRAVLGQELEI
ncbi:glutamine-synthetase adenylyltransferase [Croceibacterium ferulae]|uniref:[protein-PII] uridylyltransferase family protein n=1 Tax=Croceibacterium ferulae TaxID=1854641 RepID=UPI000EB3D417|nr:glutamine-synthetase adenylyltransferase [Croceibacterium ferulae]